MKKGTAPLSREVKSRFNVPTFMIFAAIGVGYRSPLIIFRRKIDEEGRLKLSITRDVYVRKCLARIVPQLLLRDGHIFLQDGARCHVAALKYLEGKGVNVLLDHPPYSPDMNPIEEVRPMLDRMIAEKAPATPDALEIAAAEAWAEIPQEVLDNHVLSYRSKLLKVKRDG